MDEREITELFEQIKTSAPADIRKLEKRLDGILNFLVGQVLKSCRTADPLEVRRVLIEKLSVVP